VNNIDSQRLLKNLSDLRKIGADPAGGVTRLAYTPADRIVRDWFIEQVQAEGLAASVDPIGNILAVEPGDGPPVLCGSHLDTVRGGGSFDGTLGVLAALEAVQTIRRHSQPPTRRRLGILMLAAEESTRFGSACLGSRAIVGDLTADSLTTLKDANGVSLGEALQQAGLHPDRFDQTRRSSGWFHEVVELHIDQADDLERTGHPLGIITAIAAPTRLWVTITGEQAHSGAALMAERRDALIGAAEVTLAVEAAARAAAHQEIVGTVGVLRVHPGSMNTVPGMVELGIDIRGVEAATIEDVVQRVTDSIRQITRNRGLTANIHLMSKTDPVQISQERQAAMQSACEAIGAKFRSMVSRAAHDAMYLALHGPINMLFVRNQGKISHNPAEHARDEDVALGAVALTAYLARVVDLSL
jgi:hydantoinase/carbamoylase family amidase